MKSLARNSLPLMLALLSLVGCGSEDLEVLVVQKGDVTLSIQTTGELSTEQTVELGPPAVKYSWQHKLSYLIPEGTWVEQGQKVMAFDAQQQYSRLRDLQNNLATEKQRLESQSLDNTQEKEQLELDIAEAKMELEKATLKASNVDNLMARIDVDKLKIDRQVAELNYRMAVARQNNRLEQMEVNREITHSEVQRLESELNEQLQAIQAMEVKAPRDGLVVYLPNNEGDKPAEGDQFSLIQKVVEIPDLNSLIIETTVDEQMAYKVQVGDKVEIRMDAIPERTFNGKVASMGRIVRVKSRREPSKVFDAIIELDDADSSVMRPGMAARLSIVQKVVSDAVSIPQHAIFYRDGAAFVRTTSLTGESEQSVTIAARQAGEAIVTEGLNNGDEVIL
ncbi:efflux RND transporter periplasmic adaptor subunit [Gilvimarinus sp. SDUM040013]|uniref:Efflux RND transporter periplasmic adaptor subunit n=1 Tax=Gilvimarinus gilvus TaxID=3058038 RepID=A0ABU4S3T8_9GAMM|nr:efflux RND transporter periplasmic adaptor subunit [Gilvimarinus sp. SDUM040013]MDO3384435.1 efflux RND transporter periplasmic adaptor subunit [Gilvimarinus sp. SDUM040013]MDX6851096.1 efflux RND transporter periplasmic adaptor subunit [Gilvimarinus sp. SDUM040013]